MPCISVSSFFLTLIHVVIAIATLTLKYPDTISQNKVHKPKFQQIFESFLIEREKKQKFLLLILIFLSMSASVL